MAAHAQATAAHEDAKRRKAAGEPEPITVSRRDASGWAPITDHPDTGFHRVVSSGTARRATVQEYVLEPGQRLGDWYQSDGELTVYVAEGAPPRVLFPASP